MKQVILLFLFMKAVSVCKLNGVFITTGIAASKKDYLLQ